MGLFDMFRKDSITKSDLNTARTALDEARNPRGEDDAVTKIIQRILAFGLDGVGPYPGAAKTAEAALKKNDGNVEAAIEDLVRGGVRTAAAGGFVTSLGGFVTMPVAIPANVLEFYVTATRTVGAIAKLRGYDISDPTIRSAILLTLVGSNATDILSKAGVSVGTNALGGLASKNLPRAAMMIINKAVGFRLLRSVGAKTLSRFGRLVPVLGGGVGAFADGAMLSKIGQQARQEFPAVTATADRDWGVR